MLDENDPKPRQGLVGDCWLLTGVRVLARVAPQLFDAAIREREGRGWTVRLFNMNVDVSNLFPLEATTGSHVGCTYIDERD